MTDIDDLTPEQELDVVKRVVKRGDLYVCGERIGDLGAIYKLIGEWRLKSGTTRFIDIFLEREKLHRSLCDMVDAADGVYVYPEHSSGLAELASAADRSRETLKELGWHETAEGWRRV